MSDACTACQSSRLEEATLMGAALQPVRASALRKALAGAELRARVCMECGNVDQIRANVETLQKMLGE